jgi:hypothetical protein
MSAAGPLTNGATGAMPTVNVFLLPLPLAEEGAMRTVAIEPNGPTAEPRFMRRGLPRAMEQQT